MFDSNSLLVGKKSLYLLRSLGYCLLFLFVLDFAALLAPPNFTNSAWELNLFGQIIERIPLLLLCFPLIFFGRYYESQKWKKLLLRATSWLTMVIAVLLFLGIPLTITNAIRVLNFQQNELINNNIKKSKPIVEFSARLGQANSDREILDVLNTLNPKQKSSIEQIGDPKMIKEKILSEVTAVVTKSQSDFEYQSQRITNDLWRNCVKWVIAASVSAIFLIYIWKQSKWARIQVLDPKD